MSKITFKKLYDDTPVLYTPNGYRYETHYVEHYDNDGNHYLEKADCPDDIVSMIKSNKHTCDIKTIVHKFELTGDLSLLKLREGYYGDFTNSPQSMGEYVDISNRAAKAFESLPNDIRKEYDYDLNKFLAKFGTKDWFEKLGYKFEKIDNTEVKDDDNATE